METVGCLPRRTGESSNDIIKSISVMLFSDRQLGNEANSGNLIAFMVYLRSAKLKVEIRTYVLTVENFTSHKGRSRRSGESEFLPHVAHHPRRSIRLLV